MKTIFFVIGATTIAPFIINRTLKMSGSDVKIGFNVYDVMKENLNWFYEINHIVKDDISCFKIYMIFPLSLIKLSFRLHKFHKILFQLRGSFFIGMPIYSVK